MTLTLTQWPWYSNWHTKFSKRNSLGSSRSPPTRSTPPTGNPGSTTWSILDLFANQYLFQKGLLSPTLENHKHPIESHCKNFNSLILSSHTWNISKNCPSQIYKQWRLFWNKYGFVNRSKFNPPPYPKYMQSETFSQIETIATWLCLLVFVNF